MNIRPLEINDVLNWIKANFTFIGFCRICTLVLLANIAGSLRRIARTLRRYRDGK